jgi:hypothetical protein
MEKKTYTPEEIQTAMEKRRANYEKQASKLFSTKLTEIGFTEDDERMLQQLTEAVQDRLRKAQGNVDSFLHELEKEGIGVVRDSKYLPLMATPEQKLGDFLGTKNSGPKVTALFAVSEQISSHLEEYSAPQYAGVARYREAINELKLASNYKAVIFLKANFEPKSAYHEGVHAVQHLLGFGMDRKDPKQRLQREIETNRVMWQAYQEGLLGGVTEGELTHTGTTAFGPLFDLAPGDIYQEVSYQESNLDKWRNLLSSVDATASPAEG